MATSVNIGDDLKDYLSSNSSKGRAINGSSNGSRVSSFFSSGTQRMSGWLYTPLSTEDTDGGDIDPVASGSGQQAKWSWFRTESAQSDSCLPSLSRTQRMIGFAVSIAMGLVCFCLATVYIPFLILKARKFALLFTLGSLFIVTSFSFLWGPVNHLKHLFSRERLYFTLSYLGSLVATLYCAISLQNTILTCVFGVIQVVALLWYILSYLPGGQTGLMFFSKVITKTASRSLPV